MRRFAIVLAALAVVAVPIETLAAFHAAHISEVMTTVEADPLSRSQYVEIRTDAAFQSQVGNSVLTAFYCDGTPSKQLLTITAGSALANMMSGVHWIMATATPITGVTPDVVPDFTWDPVDGTIDPTCGMVCWGAPLDSNPANLFKPKPPGTWDNEVPTNYVDCVAYGGYTGPPAVPAHSGTPTAQAFNGTFSLTRVAATNNNAADFILDCPSPTNDAGQMGTFGPCTPPPTTSTTTTTTLAGATTTTSLPAACTDVASCRTALAGTLPSAATAPNAKSRKVAAKIGKLWKTAENALDKAAGVTGKKHDKQIRKVRATLGKLLKKAAAADGAGTLGVPLAAIQSAVAALLGTLA